MHLPTPSALNLPKRVSIWERFFSLLLVSVPILLVSWVVLTYTINLPYWDDYLVQDQLLTLKSGSGSQKLVHIFDQHWEHRIIWTRLVFAFFAKLNGSLNYYGLTLIGVSGLFVVFGILFVLFRKLALPLLYFVPISFLLFTFQSYENLIWAMASIQNFWVLAFALGTFYGLAQNQPATRFLALGLAVLATFTSGNGLLVLIVGFLVLAYQRHRQFMIVWACLTIISLVGYFYTYHRISFFPSPFRYPITDWIKAFFVFLGAFADSSPNLVPNLLRQEHAVWLTMGIGVLVAILAVRFVISLLRADGVTKATTLNSFFLGCILFLFASAAITVYSRVGFSGPGYLLQGRYKIYSALTLSVVYLYSLYNWQQKSFLPRYAIGLAIIIIGQSLFSDYRCLEGIIAQHRRTVAEYFNYLANTPKERQQAISQVFTPTEPAFFSTSVEQLTAPSWLSTQSTTDIDRIDEHPFMFNIAKSNAVNPTLSRPEDGSYLFFKSSDHTYLFAARPLPNSPGSAHYFSPSGFYTQALKEKINPGRYRIGILTNQNNRIHLAMTNRYITFTSL